MQGAVQPYTMPSDIAALPDPPITAQPAMQSLRSGWRDPATIPDPQSRDDSLQTAARVPIPRSQSSGHSRSSRQHSERSYCDLCPRSFARYADLLRHQDDVHAIAKR